MIWKAIYEIGDTALPRVATSNHRRLYIAAVSIVEEWKSCMSQEAVGTLTSRKPHPPSDSGDAHDDRPSSTPSSNSSESDGDDSSDGAGPHVNDTNNLGQQHQAHPSSAISYSDYQPSLTFSSSPLQSVPSEKSTEFTESDVVEDRPDNLAPYAPWNVDDWQSKDGHAFDDLHQDNRSSTVGVDALSPNHLEKPAQLPCGPWEFWEPDFMKLLDEARLRELAERFGMI